ncbi:hypothetical protein POJ06DRAFT_213263 [Lipomyces tetrasporus]|uniref:HNH nuclease domain-containing protein n=1 Tax=Lipomyces tetrasporus TaxID=54092 RepID=A0AAD7QPN3_9ASCO|nr:uncharacterized protein POJ06DRAFT_213263 [Lipomyces tetrasporus]KAJ8098925.1 hypothetical protein POJ06DRAFT_213263 [Lipomyces tetrasporus]
MSSSAYADDPSRKTLTEALITIFRLSRFPFAFEYQSRVFNAVPIALALLERGYSPQSLSDDLWKCLAETSEKRRCLLQLVSPVGASFRRLSALIAVSPKDSRSWQDTSDMFHGQILLKTTVVNWTRGMCVDLLLSMRAKGKTPTPSGRSTATRKQRDFKQKLLARDGSFSVVGGVMERSECMPDTPLPPHGTETLIAAHIIPFCISSRPCLRQLLSIFAGQYVENLFTGDSINDPSNGLLLDAASHGAFDLYQFGLECQDKHYRIRILVRDNLLPEPVRRHNDGEEVLFGQRSQNHALPSAVLCNLHLTIGRVLHDSGIAAMIDEILQDVDEFNAGNLDGDYSLRVSASYLVRELRALQSLDELGIDSQHDEADLDNEEVLPIHRICT